MTLEAALAMADRDLRIIPLHEPTSYGPKKGPGSAACSCGAPQCESQGKHPRTARGVLDATGDQAQIREWWTRWPQANIGIATGHPFDALDIDGEAGLDALDALQPDAPPLVGPMVITGRRDGIHIWMKATGVGTKAGFAESLDWRGNKGYVVGPPSVHHLGGRYAFGGKYGLDHPLEPVPAWLLEVLKPKPKPKPKKTPRPATGLPLKSNDSSGAADYWAKTVAGLEQVVATKGEGARNDSLYWAMCRLMEHESDGMPNPGVAFDVITNAARRAGLGESEIGRTVASAGRP